jgi:hypothetical protein
VDVRVDVVHNCINLPICNLFRISLHDFLT